MFVINNNNQNYIKTTSTVKEVILTEDAHLDEDGNQVDATYSIKVGYTVDKKEYEAELDGMSKHKIGDKITIYYNPKDPSKITQTKSLILPIIFIIAGIASLIGGIVSAINAIKRHKKMKEQERSWANE